MKIFNDIVAARENKIPQKKYNERYARLLY